MAGSASLSEVREVSVRAVAVILRTAEGMAARPRTGFGRAHHAALRVLSTPHLSAEKTCASGAVSSAVACGFGSREVVGAQYD